jgi:acyl-CoA synthetase (AMP-forming)/AMP-acid ligase II
MMSGYLHNAAANAEAFFPSPEATPEARWLRTGDIVRISRAGYVTITDRQKDVIKAKGFQVSPAELEGESSHEARRAGAHTAPRSAALPRRLDRRRGRRGRARPQG